MTLPNSVWSDQCLSSAQALIAAPVSLHAWRSQQLEEFLQRGFPTRRDENWKYTPVTDLLAHAFALPKPSVSVVQPDLVIEKLPNSYQLVFIDGVFSPAHSLLADLPEKLVLTNNADQQTSVLPAQQKLSVFHWLNGALMADGLFLEVPNNLELAKPIHMVYLTTTPEFMHHPRHHIRLGAHSRVTILEEYRSLSTGSYFNNVLTHITLGENARLDYYKLQRESAEAFHIANTYVAQSRDSQVRAFHIALGSRLNREDIHFALQQPGSECELSGFYYPKAQQHIDFHTRIDHLQSHTRSRQYYKGMMADHGRGVFNGKIIAHPQAQQITAEQENHNLLLSSTAEVNTKPELEVFTDTVHCTHGATVGNLDANALFYLRSRGIPENLARHLLMCGFANEILTQLPEKTVANYIQDLVIHELAEFNAEQGGVHA